MKKMGLITVILAVVLAIASVLYIMQQQNHERIAIDHPVSPIQKEERKMLNKKNINKKFPENNQGESSNLAFSLNPTDSKNKTFTYEVQNESEKPVTIEFGTSQRYEVVLEKKGEGEVYRFSKGRMFMQVLGELVIEPGMTQKYDINLPELQPGDYSLTIFLVGKGVAESSERTIEFTINGNNT